MTLLLVSWGAAAAGSSPNGNGPFSTIARVQADDAGVRVIVTRGAGSKAVHLPAALVPALKDGDVVQASFPDFSAPNTSVRYHANVAFLGESAPQHWLYPRSGPQDRLFPPRNASRISEMVFTYGMKGRGGTPLFFIVPEDEKTRGMDGVRDYVAAHPTDFKTMAASANQTVDRYYWFRDFVGAVGSGAIDVTAQRERILGAATALGADPNALNACYTTYTAASDIQNCVKSQFDAVAYQTNFNAPTQAQFFGGLLGAAMPLTLASYLKPLLTVWTIFTHAGHQEYEYLPTTLTLARPQSGASSSLQILTGEKVPTLRPPAAFSSVLFFTIGEPAMAAPRIVDEAPAGGICARNERVRIPLHVDRTSRYLHDTELEFSSPGAASVRLTVEPDSADAPVVERSVLGDANGYRVRLSGRFGFDALAGAEGSIAFVAIPSRAHWSVEPAPHVVPVAGKALDLIASSPSAACLSSVQLQIGGSPPIELSAKPIDATHVALHGSLEGVPPGTATIRFYERDEARATTYESDASLSLDPPISVANTPEPQISLGDSSFVLQGTGLERVAAVRIGHDSFTKSPGSSADRACFAGSPPASALAGELLPAQFVATDGSPGPAFALRVLPRRPELLSAVILPQGSVHFSSDPMQLIVSEKPEVSRARLLLRRAPATTQPCSAAPQTGSAIEQQNVHAGSSGGFEADTTAANVLGDEAFGKLEVAIVDLQTQVSSGWLALPGTFVRSPSIARIECADNARNCRAFGTYLTTIAAVRTAQGDVAPDFACPAGDDKLRCVVIPRQDRYTFVLRDGNTLYDLPQQYGATGKP